MSKNQPISSVDVIPSDTINIPEPGSYLSGASSTNNLTLTTNGAKFVDGTSSVGKYQVVAGGDVVIAGTEMALITSVTSNTTITLQAAVIPGACNVIVVLLVTDVISAISVPAITTSPPATT